MARMLARQIQIIMTGLHNNLVEVRKDIRNVPTVQPGAFTASIINTVDQLLALLEGTKVHPNVIESIVRIGDKMRLIDIAWAKLKNGGTDNDLIHHSQQAVNDINSFLHWLEALF